MDSSASCSQGWGAVCGACWRICLVFKHLGEALRVCVFVWVPSPLMPPSFISGSSPWSAVQSLSGCLLLHCRPALSSWKQASSSGTVCCVLDGWMAGRLYMWGCTDDWGGGIKTTSHRITDKDGKEKTTIKEAITYFNIDNCPGGGGGVWWMDDGENLACVSCIFLQEINCWWSVKSSFLISCVTCQRVISPVFVHLVNWPETLEFGSSVLWASHVLLHCSHSSWWCWDCEQDDGQQTHTERRSLIWVCSISLVQIPLRLFAEHIASLEFIDRLG